MATTSKTGLRFDEFVKNIRPDPKSNDALVMLQGYIGKSDLEGHVRVYSDPALSDFIELPEREICYADPVRPEEDPLGGSRLWVRKTAVFTAGDPNHANRVKSSFLEGDLVKAFGGEGKIPTAVLTLDVREKISVPVTNCGTIVVSRQRSVCLPCVTGHVSYCFCPGDRTIPPICKTISLPPICPTLPASHHFPCESYLRCPVSLGCPTRVGCPSIGHCPTFGACPSLACTNINETINQQYTANQVAATTGYAGGFNPYETGNFGY